MDRLFDDPRSVLVVLRLGLVELLSALAMKVCTGELSVDAHDQARKRFLGEVKSRRLLIVRLLVGHYRNAKGLIGRHAQSRRLRTLDALQLGVALDLNEQGRIDTFVTADQPLCEVASQERLATLNPLALS